MVVENISAEGARISGHSLPAVGKPVLILSNSIDQLGRVVWANFRERGVLFDAQLA